MAMGVLGSHLMYCECGCGQITSVVKRNDKSKGWVKGQHQRFIRGHQARKSSVWWIVDEQTGCWNWQLTISVSHHYPVHSVNGKLVLAHRYFYEQKYGPIAKGYEAHHTCLNRICVNPDHVEPKTKPEHIAIHHQLKKCCRNGHVLTPETTSDRGTHRRCLICERQATRRSHAKNRAARNRERKGA